MRLLLFLSLFFIPKAYAIPPPDIVINLFQGMAQAFGIILASLVALYFAGKDMINLWRLRYPQLFWGGLVTLLILIILGLFTFFGFFQKSQTAYKEYLTIEEVIAQEPIASLRDWKLKLLQGMQDNLNQYRIANGMSLIGEEPIASVKPRDIQTLIDDGASVLDVREDYEWAQFGLDADTYYLRFGDIMNDIQPDIDPDTPLLVVCYSGTRGYLSANVLSRLGFTNVSYVQGGLGAYAKKNLPYRGTDEFKFLPETYPSFTGKELDEFEGSILVFADFTTELPDRFKLNTTRFDLETMTTLEVEEKIKLFPPGDEVLLVCGTESQCFDGANMAYLLEKKGVMVKGYYQYE